MEEDNTLSITGSYGKEKRESGTTLRPNIVNLMYTGNENGLGKHKNGYPRVGYKIWPMGFACHNIRVLTYILTNYFKKQLSKFSCQAIIIDCNPFIIFFRLDFSVALCLCDKLRGELFVVISLKSVLAFGFEG